jgi:pyridoxal phosphate enzyme (YggS family)
VGRSPEDVTLIAATKGVSVPLIQQARAAGVGHFGENYARDLAVKAVVVDATWHFIGKLQRGTARRVADHADVVHSAERGGGLAALSRGAMAGGREVPCLVQVDFTGRRQGESPEEVAAFLQASADLAGIRIHGLMTIPPPTADPEDARPYFRRLRELRDEMIERWSGVRELSMGMSADFEIGVEEGATMVRVGTALFGPRPIARPKPELRPPRSGKGT